MDTKASTNNEKITYNNVDFRVMKKDKSLLFLLGLGRLV